MPWQAQLTMSTATLANAASSGFHDAGAYDAHRPSYPDAAVGAFLAKLRVLGAAAEDGQKVAAPRIVEIGAGTGKFTELLSRQAVHAAAVGAPPAQILAVEPHDQMRAQLVAKHLPHVTVAHGHGTDLSMVEDGTADAVIAAQAFHW